MIDIEMKMFFTKELNEITVAYARKVVLKKLFLKLAFDTYEAKREDENLEFTDLIFHLAHYKNPIEYQEPNIALEIIGLVSDFIKSLDSKDLTALYFLIFNKLQDKYLDDFELNYYDETKENDLLEQFGPYMAGAIYNPEGNFLDNDLQNYLQDEVLIFADDFGHTEFDIDTFEQFFDTLDSYTNAKKLSFKMS
ncbi:MAG: hypothetical protein ACPGVH_01835 [Chitinophagales bacterium]